MIRPALLVSLLCAGCFDPTFDNPTCGPAGACPSGFQCLEGVCRGGAGTGSDAASGGAPDAPGIPDAIGFDGPFVDQDGDSIPDDVDNCPTTPNAAQADEDADGLGDPCDDCPQRSDAGQADGDGDHVGDVCDPHPGTAGDAIVFFDGFAGTTRAAAWTVGLGADTWSVSQGKLHQTTTTREEKVLYLSGLSLTTLTIETAFVPTDIPAAGANDVTRAGGVVTGFAGTSGRTGAIEDHIDSLNPGYAISMAIGGAEVGNYAYVHDAISTSRYVIRSVVDVNAQSAEVTESDGTITTGTEANVVPANGAIGLRTLNIAADFEYVVVYTSP